jgi:hypothetical protein
MTSRTLMAAALAATIAGAAPAFAQPAPAPAPATRPGIPPGTAPGTAPDTRPGVAPATRPGVAPGTQPGPTATGQPTPAPQMTFEEIAGDITSSQTISPTAIAIGAIAGVVVFNLVAPSLWPVSYLTGGPLVGTIFADSALAASRVYTVTSAAAGGWVGQWVYTNWLSR